MDKTIALLETLQKAYMKETPNSKEEFIRQNIPEIDEYLHDIDPSFASSQTIIEKLKRIKSPSRYQDSFVYIDIYEIFEAFEKIKPLLREASYSSKLINLDKKIPLFGTIPINRFTARVISAKKDTDEIILISEGLIDFASAFCSYISVFFPIFPGKNSTTEMFFLNKKNIQTTIKEKFLMEQFYSLILNYYYSKNCLQSHILNGDSVKINEPFIRGFLYFAVAHEYCHFLLGHTSDFNSTQSLGEDAIISTPNYSDEFEADLYGAFIASKALEAEGYPYPINKYGIYICLRAIEVLERINKINLVNDSSHPNADLRISRLHDFLFGSDEYLNSIELILDCLLQDFETIVSGIVSEIKNKKIAIDKVDRFGVNLSDKRIEPIEPTVSDSGNTTTNSTDLNGGF